MKRSDEVAEPQNAANPEIVFCLRQADAASFWNGQAWVEDSAAAKKFPDVDAAFYAARRLRESAIDLLVFFCNTQRSLVIPLGGGA